MHVPPNETVRVALQVNGVPHEADIDPRWLLSDVLRHRFGLTGTHVGCEHGVCGCCTILVDGRPARSCIMLAVQAEGADLRTVEGLQRPDGTLHPLQEAFRTHHGLQCGFCTPGFLMTACAFYRDAPQMSDQEIREAISGQLCRCTGYKGIIDAIRAAGEMETREGPP